MPKIIKILKKKENDPWIMLGDDYYNQEEKLVIIDPYLAYINSLPGLIKFTTVVDDNITIITTEFDTLEHMLDAKEKLYGKFVLDPIVAIMNSFFQHKLKEKNISYQRTLVLQK